MAALSDAELLAGLSEGLSPGELTATLERVLRLPQAWHALHTPEFLESVRREVLPAPITAARLAAHSLGGADLKSAKTSLEMESRANALWDQATKVGVVPVDLQDVALLALALQRREGVEEIADMIQAARQHPRAWRAAFAAVLPSLARREDWLKAWLGDGGEAGLSLTVNALLANLAPRAAAEILAALTPAHIADLSVRLRRLGEPVASSALAEIAGSSAAAGISGPTLESLFESASLRLAQGDAAAARRLLERAWESSVDASAAIADRLAESAETEGDTVVASHALELAHRARPTPARRARWAHSLADSGRPGDALQAMPESVDSVEETIASAWIHLRRGEADSARLLLQRAATDVASSADPEPAWLDRLAKGLRELGEVELALSVMQAGVAAFPGSAAIRLDYAQMLFEGQEWSRSIGESRVLLALAPGSSLARRILAGSLVADGRAAEALPHWQMLASADTRHAPALIECALAARETELAGSALESIPDSEEKTILSTQVLLARGEPAEAAAALAAAARRWPESDRVLVWLAQAQDAAGEFETAESTLDAALRSFPSAAPVLHAVAERRMVQGRPADAVDSAQLAYQAAPAQPETGLTLARALIEVGRSTEAIPVLRAALSRWPGLSTARLCLARALEAEGEFSAAADLFTGRADPRSTDDMRLVGRIYARAGIGGHSKRLLLQAQSIAPQDPELAFWLARAHEACDEPLLALEAFRDSLRWGAVGDVQQQAVLGTARAALASGDISLAISTLEEARRSQAETAELLALLSRAYLAAHLEDQALSAAESWLTADPGEKALSNLAEVASLAGRWDRALSACQELATRRPQDSNVWLHLAQAQWKAFAPAAARSSMARAISLARQDSPTLARAAEVVAAAGELRTAHRILRRASSGAPENLAITRAFALISDRLADSQASLEAWSRLTVLTPDDASAWKGAASAAWHRDLRAAAVGHWQKALALAPEDLSLKITLARALLQNGEADPALQMYTTARAQDPRDADLALEAGLAELRHGAAEGALVTLAQAAQLAPAKPEPQIALAECLVRLGRSTEAADALDLAQRVGDLSARGHALRALTCLAAGDLPEALASIAEARSRPARTSDDAQWVARAALALGQWSIALQALEDRMAEKPDAILLPDILHTRLRLAQAQWAFVSAAEALRHAPDETGLSRVSFENWIGRGPEFALGAAWLEDMRAAFLAVIGEASPETIARLIDLSVESRDAEIAHALAIGQLRAHQYGEARHTLESAKATDVWGWSSLLLGIARAAAGDSVRAFEAYATAEANPSLRALSDWLGGRAALADGDPESAARAFNSALAIWPDEPAWHAQLASLYLDQGSLETALPHLQQAVELAPDHSDYLLILARALRDAGQLSEASAVYERVVQAMPRLGSVWKEAAELSLAVGDAARAQRWFERACTLAPADASALMGAARSALALGEMRQANEHAQAAQRVAPEDPEVLLGWGEILAAQGKSEKALEALEKARASADDPMPVQMARSRLLIKVGRTAEAVAEMRDAVGSNPDDDHAHAALAEACEAAGDLSQGLESAAQAARLAPRVVTHRVLLGRLARGSGQLDRALSELTQAQSLAPADGRVAVELGRVHEERRELKRALDAYQRAIEIDPDLPTAHFRAGLILKDLKAYSQAGRMFKRAVELAPTDAEALHQLAAVRALELVHGGIAAAAASS